MFLHGITTQVFCAYCIAQKSGRRREHTVNIETAFMQCYSLFMNLLQAPNIMLPKRTLNSLLLFLTAYMFAVKAGTYKQIDGVQY